MKNIIVILLVLIISLLIPLSADVEKQIVVMVDAANIRSLAGLNGDIIGKTYNGEVFKVLGLEGSWYKISFVNKKGEESEGYIHKEIVKIVPADTKLTSPIPPPPSKKEVKQSVKKVKQKKVVKKKRSKFEQEKLFSGFYLKGGVMTSPKVDSFGEKWIVSLGFDSPIGNYLTWGLEFQPYYRNFSDDLINLTMHSLASNIFLNVKGGVNPGRFYKPLKFLTLYGGLGIGSSLSFFYVDIDGASGSEFDVMFAWHFMFGGEISLGKMNVIIEFQGVKVVDPDIDPSTMSLGYFLIGLRF